MWRILIRVLRNRKKNKDLYNLLLCVFILLFCVVGYGQVDTVENLIKKLNSASRVDRDEAAIALGEIGGTRVVNC